MPITVDTITQLLSFLNARACVSASADAYREPPDIFDNQTDTQVRVVRGQCSLRGGWVGFFFRGTFNLPGWFRDFDPAMVTFGKGRAHKKTAEGVESVLGKIRMAIPDKRDAVFVGGHSKGAREGQNCADVLQRLGYNVVGVYTFGTPRGFDYNAAHDFNSRLKPIAFRFVNGSDIVCRVPSPPHWWAAGQELFLPVGDILGAIHSADWTMNPSLLYKLACDGRELFREWRRNIPVFADHQIQAYVDAVKALQ